MLKVLLVDDEDIIREGIKNNIRWTENDCIVVGEACDGTEALELVECLQPDVVITDIKMKHMDGLQFIERMRTKYIGIYVVILSGYNSFEYAQRAIDCGACKFMLKPVKTDEIESCIREIQDKIANEKLKEDQLEKLRMQVVNSRLVIREQTLRELLFGNLMENEMDAALSYVGVSLKKSKFAVLIINIEDYSLFAQHSSLENKQLLYFAVINSLSELLSPNITLESVKENKPDQQYICLLNYDGEIIRDSELIRIIEDCKKQVERVIHIKTTFGLGGTFENYCDTSRSLKQAQIALKQKVILGSGNLIHYSDVIQSRGELSLYQNSRNQCLEAFQTLQLDEAKKAVIDTIDKFVASSYSQVYVHVFIMGYVSDVLQYLYSLGVQIVDENFGSFVSLEHSLSQNNSVNTLKQWIEDFINKAINCSENGANKNVNNLVSICKKFICQNYQLPEMCLRMVSEYVGVSSNYLSRIFKEVTNESYVDYLSNVRINKAKSLLKDTTMKVYEVAFAVGYNNTHYFSITFKRYTGLTPNEFRNR